MRQGYYCEDCDCLLTDDQYPLHNADHTLRKIYWSFIGPLTDKDNARLSIIPRTTKEAEKCPGCGKPRHPNRVCKKKDFDNYRAA